MRESPGQRHSAHPRDQHQSAGDQGGRGSTPMVPF